MSIAKMHRWARVMEGIRHHSGSCVGCSICAPPFDDLWRDEEGRQNWLNDRPPLAPKGDDQ